MTTPAPGSDAIPAPAREAGVGAVRTLDVRPIFASGGAPCATIMDAVAALRPAEALELVVPFEPAPLYRVLGAKGFRAHTERRDDAYHVFFFAAPAESSAEARP